MNKINSPWSKAENYKLGPLDRNTSFERSLSKLSENRNIFDIGSTVLKLMAVEKSGLFLELSFRGHNLC